nr:TniQ family protein [uncultured Roseateles sp.]
MVIERFDAADAQRARLFVPSSLPPLLGAERVALHSMFRLVCEANLLSVNDVLSLPATGLYGGGGVRKGSPHDLVNVNSGRDPSKRLAGFLETLTGQTELMSLTLRDFEDIDGVDALGSAPFKRWCPACYEADAAADTPIYDRLLWSIRMVNRCPIHDVWLEEQCRNCGRSDFKHLAGLEVSGFCPRCRCWLGARATPSGQKDDAADYSGWVAAAMSELLHSMPPLQDVRPKFAQALRTLAGAHHQGRMAHLARQIGRNKSVVATWTSESARPGWDVLCSVSYVYQVPLTELLDGEVSVLALAEPRTLPTSVLPRQGRKRRLPIKRDIEELREFLERAALGGYTRIASVKAVAEALRVDVRTLYSLLPEEAKSAAEAFRLLRHQRSEEKNAMRLESLKPVIVGATKELLTSGLKVTRRALHQKLRDRGVELRWGEYRAAKILAEDAASAVLRQEKRRHETGAAYEASGNS